MTMACQGLRAAQVLPAVFRQLALIFLEQLAGQSPEEMCRGEAGEPRMAAGQCLLTGLAMALLVSRLQVRLAEFSSAMPTSKTVETCAIWMGAGPSAPSQRRLATRMH